MLRWTTTRTTATALAALVAACLTLGFGQASWVLHGHEDVEVEWHRFRRHYRRGYHNETEELYRFGVFQASFNRALARNAANVRAGGHRVFGVTRFSDETQEEFDRRYKGRKGHGRGARWEQGVRKPLALLSAAMAGEEDDMEGAARPPAVDWTGKATTSVNNQGQCGSCWAFSLTQQVESAWIMAGHAPWRLSVQQATSCTSGTFGCGGGDTIEGYEQLLAAATKRGMPVPGLVSASMAPYIQSMTSECLSPTCTERCTLRGVGNLTVAEEMEGLTGFYVGISGWDYGTPPCDDACESQDLELLKANIAEFGPASICVNAATWNDYVEGVLMPEACGGFGYSDLDHCVQVVGYDDSAPEPYFKVRNSWATTYGVDGHILLSSRANTCGLANEATFVTVAPQPAEA